MSIYCLNTRAAQTASSPSNFLRYKLRIWEQQLRQSPLDPLRPILPVAIYHGAFPWRVSTRFVDLVEAQEELRPYLLDFPYQLCDLSHLSAEEIKGTALLQAVVQVMADVGRRRVEENLYAIMMLLKAAVEQTGLQFLETVLRYLSSAGEQLGEEKLIAAVQETFTDKEEVIVTTLAEKWMRQGIEKGLKEGLEQGIQQGRAEAKREALISGIEVGLDLRFGAEGLRILPEILKIEDAGVLRAILTGIRTEKTLTEIRYIYS
jgi:hypothetical protein